MKDRSLIWFVNPFDEKQVSMASAIEVLKFLSEGLAKKIFITYVCDTSNDLSYPKSEDLVQFIIQEAKKGLDAFSKSLNLQNTETVILENETGSQSEAVFIAHTFVKEINPDFVVMQSHGKSLVKRIFLGSFTESMLTTAHAPCVILNPDIIFNDHSKTAYMPLSVGQASRKFLKEIGHDSKMLIFKKLEIVSYCDTSSADFFKFAGQSSIYGIALETDFKSKEQYILDLKTSFDKMIQDSGVKDYFECKARFEEGSGQSNNDFLIKDSNDSNSAFVVLKSYSKLPASFFIGSTAKQILLHSNKPVIFYPKTHS